MTTRYRPKHTEVDALQFTLTNIGEIIRKIQDCFEQPVIFNVSINEDNNVFIKFENGGYAAEQGDYFIFDKTDFDILTEQEFKNTFEPIISDSKSYCVFSSEIGKVVPSGFAPYEWNKLIATD